MAATRRAIARVPNDKGDLEAAPQVVLAREPVPARRADARLAYEHGDRDRARPREAAGLHPTDNRLVAGDFDKLVIEARATLAAATDDDFAVSWSLKRSGHVLLTLSRREVVRQSINHLVHHRAQLTVYLEIGRASCRESV